MGTVPRLLASVRQVASSTPASALARPRVGATCGTPLEFWLASGMSRRGYSGVAAATAPTRAANELPFVLPATPTARRDLPPAPPAAVPASVVLRQLTRRVRAVHRSSPALSPSALVAQLDPPPPSEPPPAPPPLIPLLPDPHRPNPHLVGAFWLQALFLGASALGLLARRKQAGPVEDRQERDERIEDRERAEALEINLLLASYMPWPEDDTPLSALTPWIPLSASPTQPGKSIAAVTAALAQFSAAGLKPDRWTVLSLMSCVGALPTTPPSTPTKSDLARPVIALCAWRAFADLPRSPETAATDLALLRAFVDYLANPPPFAQDLTAELLSSISHLLATSPPPSLPIPNPYPSLVASLAPIALAHNNLGALQALIARESPLDPFQKIQISVHTLELIAADEELRNTREVVRDFGEAFADNVRQLYGCGQREWTRRIRPDKVALDAEGSAPVHLSVPPAEEEEDSADGRPTPPRRRNAAHRAQLRVNLIRRGIDLLRAEFRVDVPLEDLYADATLVLLTFTPSSLAEAWLLTILRSLVASRHPRLALSLFDTVPSSSLTLEHFNALLRTHHLPTSSLVFLRLLSHPTLSPTLPSFHARLISHRHNLAVEPAHNDLHLMRSLDIPRDSKAWNLLLTILARAGSDRELFRHWVRMEQAGISPDVYSWNILLGRTTRARPPPRRDSDVPSRRTTHGGAGRVGSSQLRTVIRTLESTTPSPDLSIPASPSSIASNTLLRSLGRWSSEVNTPHLVALTRTVLGIDLVLDADDPFDGFRNKPVPTRLEWEEEREPAYATLEKALRNRGETVMRKRLVYARAVEERYMRRREREAGIETVEQ